MRRVRRPAWHDRFLAAVQEGHCTDGQGQRNDPVTQTGHVPLQDATPKEYRNLVLIAEEVAKVNPALVLPDKEGKPYTVRYDAVNAMLLNEFLKEHRKVEKLEAALRAVNERLAEQDAKIQKSERSASK